MGNLSKISVLNQVFFIKVDYFVEEEMPVLVHTFTVIKLHPMADSSSFFKTLAYQYIIALIFIA